jgi:hypothetical protein
MVYNISMKANEILSSGWYTVKTRGVTMTTSSSLYSSILKDAYYKRDLAFNQLQADWSENQRIGGNDVAIKRSEQLLKKYVRLIEQLEAQL